MDREALGHLATLMGEASMTLNALERKKIELKREIEGVDREIEWTRNRETWLEEAYEALRISQIPLGDHDWKLTRFDEDHQDDQPARHEHRCTFCNALHISENEEVEGEIETRCIGLRSVGSSPEGPA